MLSKINSGSGDHPGLMRWHYRFAWIAGWAAAGELKAFRKTLSQPVFAPQFGDQFFLGGDQNPAAVELKTD